MTKTKNTICTIENQLNKSFASWTHVERYRSCFPHHNQPREGEDSRTENVFLPGYCEVRRLTISMPIPRHSFCDKSAKLSFVYTDHQWLLLSFSSSSPQVFFFSAKIARTHSYAWSPWQFYLPGRRVNIVNGPAGLCYADHTGLPRGQTSASLSGPG